MYYTYILISLNDNKLYIGFTSDLKNRYQEHCNGLVDSTRERRPLKLIYYEACLDKNKAIRREKFFKSGYGRRFLESRL